MKMANERKIDDSSMSETHFLFKDGTDGGSPRESVQHCAATTRKSNETIMPEAVISVKEGIGAVFGVKPEDDTAVENPTDMMVIGAGTPRTGTASLREALQRLGLKSYHMKMAIFMDSSLWYQHALQRLKGEPGIYPQIIQEMAHKGYNATVDSPNYLYYKELMKEYPSAKVILGVRVSGGGKSFAKSSKESIARIAPLLERVPFRWSLVNRKKILEWLKVEQGCPLDPKTHLPNDQCLADYYDDWIQKVQETVPAEQLLVFKTTDGWEPLCDFLSPLDPIIETNCQEILENQEPFPYVNDTSSIRSVINVFEGVAMVFENAPMFFVFCWLFWMMVVKRRRKASTEKSVSTG